VLFNRSSASVQSLTAELGGGKITVGGTQASVVSGTVTINQVTYAPTCDFGSILSWAAPAAQSPTTPSPRLDNMELDKQGWTSSYLAVHAS
jgi:hypothetical protein